MMDISGLALLGLSVASLLLLTLVVLTFRGKRLHAAHKERPTSIIPR
jgi:hypothetical protein